MASALYPSIDSRKPRLRVGVLLSDLIVPAWTAEVLQSIRQSDVADLAAVVVVPTHRTPSPPRISALARLLWDLYLRIDRQWHGSFEAPFEPIDIEPLIRDCKVVRTTAFADDTSALISDRGVAEISAQRLDVLLDLVGVSPPANIPGVAKYGLWYYHFGDGVEPSGALSTFWNMYERNPLSCVTLRVLAVAPIASGVIYRSYGSTTSFESLLISRYWVHRKAVPFVVRSLHQLHTTGSLGVEPQATISPAASDRVPRNGTVLIFFLRVLRAMIAARLQERFGLVRDHWFIAFARGVHRSLPDDVEMTAVPAPPGKSWADPMVVKKGAINYVFLEELDYRNERGRIVVLEIDEHGVRGEPRLAMAADHHLSYPFVFEWNGTHYMVPESADIRAVRLFRAIEFPTRWEYIMDLLSGVSAVDATLFEHGDRWYLFASVSESGGSHNDELFLFHAESPLGPWLPHPRNPLVSDVRCARPAGALFLDGSRLFRPAQNGAETYGHSVSIAEIAVLSPTEYAERVTNEIAPHWMPGLSGTHTLSFSDDLTVVDGKRVAWRP